VLINSLIKINIRRLSLAALLLVLPLSSWALNVGVIYDTNSRYQTSFADALFKLSSKPNDIKLSTIRSESLSITDLKNQQFDVIVNLDTNTGEKIIASNLRTTVLHALTTLSRSRKLTPCLPHCLKSLPRHRFFVLDQPAARQLSLLQLINPAFKTVGVIVTQQSEVLLESLTREATRKQLIINDHVSNAENVRYQIDSLSKSSDVILAVADTSIYNASSLSQILLTSYRYRTPVIGFSKGFIKAGAIGGTVSSIDQLAKHLTEALTNTKAFSAVKNGNVIYPKYFDVITNRNVANSLNLHFASDDELKEQLITNEATR
jgi:hypothetical protein